MSEHSELVQLELATGVARIRFNSPKTLNALDVAMAHALLSAVRQAQKATEARVIVLSGIGRAFMAGGDLQCFHANLDEAAGTARAIIEPLHEAVALLGEGRQPVICGVQGAVAGAGLSLALGCDLVVAADNARFVPAYARIAASQDGGGSWALPRRVGLSRALEIMLLAEPFGAPQALAWGVVNRVVAETELEATVTELASRLSQGPTQAFGQIRGLLRQSLQRTHRAQLEQEREAFARCAATQDFREGVAAFLEKRPAQFRGT